MKKKKASILSISYQFMGVVFIFFYWNAAIAQPPLSWTPRTLIVELTQGSASTYEVSLNVKRNSPDMAIRIVPELSQWVSVSPIFIPENDSDSELTVTIYINLPPDAPLGTFDGVIQLRRSVVGEPQNVFPRPLPVEITILEFDDSDLPPDPGEEGRLTLLGIDTDNDGVRDDIQRYIYFNYINDEGTMIALTEVAKQFQILLSGANDPNTAFNNATRMARHGECLDYLVGEEAADILDSLRAETLNTEVRSRAYIQYNDNLGGEIILGRPLANWGNSCAFDINTIGEVQ